MKVKNEKAEICSFTFFFTAMVTYVRRDVLVFEKNILTVVRLHIYEAYLKMVSHKKSSLVDIFGSE